jgi:hypothetical protein
VTPEKPGVHLGIRRSHAVIAPTPENASFLVSGEATSDQTQPDLAREQDRGHTTSGSPCRTRFIRPRPRRGMRIGRSARRGPFMNCTHKPLPSASGHRGADECDRTAGEDRASRVLGFHGRSASVFLNHPVCAFDAPSRKRTGGNQFQSYRRSIRNHDSSFEGATGECGMQRVTRAHSCQLDPLICISV